MAKNVGMRSFLGLSHDFIPRCLEEKPKPACPSSNSAGTQDPCDREGLLEAHGPAHRWAAGGGSKGGFTARFYR